MAEVEIVQIEPTSSAKLNYTKNYLIIYSVLLLIFLQNYLVKPS